MKKVVYMSLQCIASPKTKIAGASRGMRESWDEVCEDKLQIIGDLTCDAGDKDEEVSFVKNRSHEEVSSEDFAPWGGPYMGCFDESERLWHGLGYTNSKSWMC